MDGKRRSTRASSRLNSTDSNKSKDASEKVDQSHSGDIDNESVSSSSSVRECRVVLNRVSSAAFNTRSRRKSTLTVDNLAALSSPSKSSAAKQTESVLSGDTTSTVTRTRSQRLSSSQNTPKKEPATTLRSTGTPKRRNSRLVESVDMETTTSSPAIPAKRKLRSNSIASEDVPMSPSTRRSTRNRLLSDTQGTPSKIKVETDSVMTPSKRTRATKRVVEEVIEEQPDEEIPVTQSEKKEIREVLVETVTIVDLGDDSSNDGQTVASQSQKSKRGRKPKASVEKKAQETPVVKAKDSSQEEVEQAPVSIEQTPVASPQKKTKPTLAVSEKVVEEPKSPQIPKTPVKGKTSPKHASEVPAKETDLPSQTIEEVEINQTIDESMHVDEPIETKTLETSQPIELGDMNVTALNESVMDKSPKMNPQIKLNDVTLNTSISTPKSKTPIKEPVNVPKMKLNDVTLNTSRLDTPNKKTPSKEPANSATSNESSAELNESLNTVAKENSASVDESTLIIQKVDAINIASSESGGVQTPTNSKERLNESELMNVTSGQATDVPIIEPKGVTKTPSKISPRADLEFMYATDSTDSTPKSNKNTPKQSRKSEAHDAMNVTALVDETMNEDPVTPKVKAVSPKKPTPKAKTPSKNLNEFADMEVSVLAQEAARKSITPRKNAPAESKSEIIVEVSDEDSASLLIGETMNEDPLTPKVEAVSPKKQTPKTKTPSKNLNEFADMEVSMLAQEAARKSITPRKNAPAESKSEIIVEDSDEDSASLLTPTNVKKTPKPSRKSEAFGAMNVTDLVDETMNEDSATPKVKAVSPKQQTPKTKTPSKKSTVTPQKPVPAEQISKAIDEDLDEESTPVRTSAKKTSKSPKSKNSAPNSPFTVADQSMNLNLEITKIYESLQSPAVDKKANKVNSTPSSASKGKDKVDVFATHSAPLDDTVEPMEIDESILETPKSVHAQSNNASRVENDDAKNVSVTSASSRKSVQIMTPKTDAKNVSIKRIDTPYPDQKTIQSVMSQNSSIEDAAKRFKGAIEEYDSAIENLNVLSQSWNKSVKRNSIGEDGPSSIDGLGVQEPKVKESSKKAVPARNNWSVSKGLIDSDSESDVEDDVENEEESDDDDDSEHSGFKADEAEYVEDYESGDSLEEEDREYLHNNEVKHKGINIGSDDTDEDSDEDSEAGSMDSFIVDDTEAPIEDSDEEISDQEIGSRRQDQYNRIMINDSSSDDENSSGIVVVSMEQVQQVVVVGQNGESQITEGRTFETTVFKNNDDDEEKQKTKSKKTNEPKRSKINDKPSTPKVAKPQTEVEENVSDNEPNLEPVKSAAEVSEEHMEQPQEESNTSAENSLENQEPKQEEMEHTDESHKHNESDVSTSSKENDMIRVNVPKKTNRHSLAGIEPLPKTPLELAKKLSRKSLGNMMPNQQVLNVSPVHVQYTSKPSLKNQSPLVRPTPKVPLIEDKEDESSDSSEDLEPNTSSKSFDSKVASSQEENNNKKLQKAKAVTTSEVEQTTANKSAKSKGSTFEEQDAVDEEAGTSSQSKVEADTSDSKKAKKQKRKFNEIDQVAGPSRKPKKYLNIISTTSGAFIEEPMTPEKKNKFGFKELPMTPINRAFQIEQMKKSEERQQVAKIKKRKIIHIEEPVITLPQPKWSINAQEPSTSHAAKRSRTIHMGPTEVIIRPLPNNKRKKTARELIPKELVEFRKTNLYRNGIPRQDARELLLEKQKRLAVYR